MNYANVRDEIATELGTVSGMGKVFKSLRFVTDWGTFFNRFVTDFSGTKRTVVCWIGGSGPTQETGLNLVGDTDERDLIEWTDRHESYLITLVVGFKDDDTAPSEFDFMTLVDAIEAKFRFGQNLNAKCDKQYPLQRQALGLFMFADQLCHKAEWLLELRFRVENTNADA